MDSPDFAQLGATLEALPNRIRVFFRDDDIGWADDALFALLDICEEHAVPIDLAAIPQALTPSLNAALRLRLEAAPTLFSIHQHGFAHVNHEPAGRKCEFGPSRAHALQAADIAHGAARLAEAFNGNVAPIFTPPWNRYSEITCALLADQGFAAISSDHGARQRQRHALRNLPVDVDWSRLRGTLSASGLVDSLTQVFDSKSKIGIMLHHADYDAAERAVIRTFLHMLCRHPKIQLTLMRNLLY